MVSVFELQAAAFDGYNMFLKLGDKRIAEIQAVTAKATREMSPIYTMPGTPTRGKRGIAGSVVFNSIEDEEAYSNDEKKTIEVTFECEDGVTTVYYITEVDLLNGPPVERDRVITFVGKEILKGEIENGPKRE